MPWVTRSIPRLALQVGGEKEGAVDAIQNLPVSREALVRSSDDFTEAWELPLSWKLLQSAQVTSGKMPTSLHALALRKGYALVVMPFWSWERQLKDKGGFILAWNSKAQSFLVGRTRQLRTWDSWSHCKDGQDAERDDHGYSFCFCFHHLQPRAIGFQPASGWAFPLQFSLSGNTLQAVLRSVLMVLLNLVQLTMATQETV